MSLAPGATYAGRSKDIVPVGLSLEREALAYARQRAIGKHAVGRYLSRLVYEDRAREEERHLAAVLRGLPPAPATPLAAAIHALELAWPVFHRAEAQLEQARELYRLALVRQGEGQIREGS
jgi:hypothetical protein